MRTFEQLDETLARTSEPLPSAPTIKKLSPFLTLGRNLSLRSAWFVRLNRAMIDLSAFPRWHVSNALSPLRYPGGKGFLTNFVAAEIQKRFGEKLPTYVEPYCGGAGAAFNLLKLNAISNIIINDADQKIYSFWKAITEEKDRFIDEIRQVPVTLSSWDKYINIVYDKKVASYDFDLAFASFFINRTSRSGVIIGSGPIGGYNQTGKWKIDARFNKESLISKIEKIHSLRERIQVRNEDAINFLNELKSLSNPNSTFIFIDPPYVTQGSRLYFDGMTEHKHICLADWLKTTDFPNWMLTYDDHPLIREAYSDMSTNKICVQYSLSRKRSETELLYTSYNYG